MHAQPQEAARDVLFDLVSILFGEPARAKDARLVVLRRVDVDEQLHPGRPAPATVLE